MASVQPITRLLQAVVVACVVTTAFGQDMSSVVNSPHNLNTADVWGVVIEDNRVCLPCHIPHNAMKDGDDSMILWDINTGEAIRRFESDTGNVYGVDFSPDGITALSGSEDILILWNIETGEEIRRFEGHYNDQDYKYLNQQGRSLPRLIDVRSRHPGNLDQKYQRGSDCAGCNMLFVLKDLAYLGSAISAPFAFTVRQVRRSTRSS